MARRPLLYLIAAGCVLLLTIITITAIRWEPATTTTSRPPEPAPPPAATAHTATDETKALNVAAMNDRLKGLQSYRLRFSFSFQGTDEQGRTQAGTIELLQDVIARTKDQHTRWIAKGDSALGSGISKLEFFTIDGSTYLYSPEQSPKCATYSSHLGAIVPVKPFEPRDVIGGMKKAQLIKSGEMVNGVVTDHYRSEEVDLKPDTFESASGDVWLAQDGKYLVRYTGQASGKQGPLGRLTDGRFAWQYDVEHVNELQAIVLPEECVGQRPTSDIPTPPGATEKSTVGHLTVFRSSQPPADIAEFFKRALRADGWTADKASSEADQETLVFTKGTRVLSVVVRRHPAGSAVVIEAKSTSEQP